MGVDGLASAGCKCAAIGRVPLLRGASQAALLAEREREAGDARGEAQAEPVAFGSWERHERVEALAAHGDDAVVDV